MTPIEARLLVTGHLLQMLDELASRRRPPDTVYVRAAEWIRQTLNSPATHYNVFWLCPFTHGSLSVREVLMHENDGSSTLNFHHTE
jgi:hypothetical protein